MHDTITDAAKPLGSPALQQYIDRHAIDARIIPLAEHTATVAAAAAALGVDTVRIIKSLVFQCEAEPLLVITNGLARVDRKKLAALLGVGRKKVKFAAAEEALAITGFMVGSMPPFGHHRRLKTIVDPAVMELDTIYGGGGDLNAMMRLASGELIHATAATVAEVAEEQR